MSPICRKKERNGFQKYIMMWYIKLFYIKNYFQYISLYVLKFIINIYENLTLIRFSRSVLVIKNVSPINFEICVIYLISNENHNRNCLQNVGKIKEREVRDIKMWFVAINI